MSDGENAPKLDEIGRKLDDHIQDRKEFELTFWRILNGVDGKLGLSQKVAILWSGHILVATAFGTLIGSILTALVLKWNGIAPLMNSHEVAPTWRVIARMIVCRCSTDMLARVERVIIGEVVKRHARRAEIEQKWRFRRQSIKLHATLESWR